eukprot:COSAG04_NODE_3170_length_3093_cov_1.802605_3_plen_559_part_00
MAITTLTALLDGEESCLIVLRRGGRDRFLNLLRSRDGALKNGAAASLQVLMRVADPEHGAQMREDECLAAVFAALSEAVDVPLLLALLNVTQDVIQCAPTPMAGPTTELRLRMMHLGLSDILQRHAHRLVVLLSAHERDAQDRPALERPASPSRDGKSSPQKTPAPLMLLRRVMKLLLELLKGRRVVRLFANSENLRFVFFLCRHSCKRVSRGASRLLSRLSDLPEAKSLILSDRANLPQLLALSSALSHVSQTVARVLAELAEAWQNRCPLVQGGILASVTALMMSSWTGSTRYNCARCVADLAEAVDLRELIASRAATALNQLLKNPQDNESVVEQALRAIVNLVCPAGEVATVPTGSNVPQEAPGRYGLSVGVEYGVASDDDDDDDDEEEEDDGDDDDEEEEADTVVDGAGSGGGKATGPPSPGRPEQPARRRGGGGPARRCGTSASAAAAWRKAIGAVAPQAYSRLNETHWWSTAAGQKHRADHNRDSLARIHAVFLSNQEIMGRLIALMRSGDDRHAHYARLAVELLAGRGRTGVGEALDYEGLAAAARVAAG